MCDIGLMKRKQGKGTQVFKDEILYKNGNIVSVKWPCTVVWVL